MGKRLILLFAAGVLCRMAAQEPPPIPKLTAHNFPKPADRGAAERAYIPGYPKEWFANAYLGNGLIGIRPEPNPLAQAKTVVSGFVYSNPSGAFENIAPAPYPLGTDIVVNGTSLLEHPELVTVRSQTLDMATGELTTEMTFAPDGGVKVDLTVVQFASRSTPSLLCQEILFTSSKDVAMEVFPKMLRDALPIAAYREQVPNPRVRVDQVLGLRSDRGSKLGVVLLHPPEAGVIRKQAGRYVVAATQSAPARFRTIAAMVSSAYHPDPDLEAIRIGSWGGMVGFDVLRERNRIAWAELWKSRVKVYGDAEAQQALDAAFFYLHSSAHAAGKTGVAPFGLSQYKDYFGHVFWDMDHWVLPAVLPAAPDAAKAMLQYRLAGLPAAQHSASMFGFRGAMFPWEAGLDGSNVTPSEAETGWAEHHVNPEVALAAWEYLIATGDPAFLRETAWPLIKGLAEWIESRGQFTARGFEFQNLMGHNEWLTNVHNDSHFNLICKMVMTAAVRTAGMVGIDPPPSWRQIERSIYLPIDKERRILLPYDRETRVSLYNEPRNIYEEVSAIDTPKAYTLVNSQMLVFHDPPLDAEVFRNTWQFEETFRLTLPPAPNVPSSVRAPGFTTPPLAACAAMFGDREKAAELFRLAREKYSVPPYAINKEYQSYRDGNYLMNQASLLMAAMYGFTGLRISEGDWRRYPATLPEGWTKIVIDRIWIKGKPVKVLAEHGKTAVIEPLER